MSRPLRQPPRGALRRGWSPTALKVGLALLLAGSACSADPEPDTDGVEVESARPDAARSVDAAAAEPSEPVGVDVAGPLLAAEAGESLVCATSASGLVLCAEVGADGTLETELRSVRGVSDARQVAVGADFACALLGDGGVRCWGDGRRGALGPEHIEVSAEAVAVGGLPPLVNLAAGGSVACGIDEAGVAWCWGDGYFGQTGAGLAPTPSAPAPIESLAEVDTIAVGARHACAVHRDGLMSCWGDDRYGQLGRGGATPNNGMPARPGLVDELPAVQEVALGSDHTCVRTPEGEVLCWGNNRDGQLGRGDTDASSRPGRPTIQSGARALFAGPDYTCAIGDGEAVQCWGANAGGLLDPALGARVLLPVPPPGLGAAPLDLALGRGVAWTVEDGGLTPWRAAPARGALAQTPPPPASVRLRGSDPGYLALGPSEARGAYCLVDRDGLVACAGANERGQVGDGTLNPRPEPVALPLPSNVRQVAVGARHACAISGDGGVWCWGDNEQGAVGAPDLAHSSVPLRVAGVGGVSSLALGRGHSCALTERGDVLCWGDGRHAQLGRREVGSDPRPAVVPLAERAVELAAAGDSSCARLVDGAVWCWGGNELGQLATGDTGDRLLPGQARFPEAVGRLLMGPERLCAELESGAVACAGASAGGESEVALTGRPFEPEPVIEEGLRAAGAGRSAAGDGFVCAASPEGAPACVGASAPEVDGLPGGGTWVAGGRRLCAVSEGGEVSCVDGPPVEVAAEAIEPVPAMPLPTAERGVVAIAGGARHTCAMLEDATLRCWGANDSGQLGQGHTDPVEEVVAVTGFPPLLLVEGAGDLTCVKAADQRVYCWGGRWGGASGALSPTAVEGFTGVVDIAVGRAHVCGSIRGGTVRCAGGNDTGQLGRGEAGAEEPVADSVQALGNVVRLVAGDEHTCALDESGRVWCWGENGVGQLGDGSFADAAAPRRATSLESADGEADPVGALYAGGDTTCSVTRGGDVRCVGETELSEVEGRVSGLYPGHEVACAASDEGRLACWSAASGAEPWPWSVPDTADVVLGEGHGCVLRASSGLLCWGEAPGGALPPGELTRTLVDLSNPPEREPIDLSAVEDVAVSDTHTCAIAEGAVRCWGDNRGGGVGADAEVYAIAPHVVEGLEASAIAAGENASCAITQGGSVSCWGDNSEGLVGQPRETRLVAEPTRVPAVEDIVELEMARRHACARSEGGEVWCWGDNRGGTLASGDRLPRDEPVWVVLPEPAVELALSDTTSCARDAAGAVYCWGELRRASFQSSATLLNLAAPVAQLAGGARFMCARDEGGAVGCWGGNEQGQLGQGVCRVRSGYQPVALPGPAVDLWAGREGACARLGDGATWCWGSASFVEGAFASEPLPVRVAELDSAVGVWPESGRESCIVRADGSARCWPHEGALGTGERGPCDSVEPVLVAAAVDDFCVGGEHACRLEGGQVVCWGDNDEYQSRGTHGDASGEESLIRIEVPVVLVACGMGHSCAIGNDGYARCWGANHEGQVHPTGYALARLTAIPEAGQVASLALGGHHSCAIDDEGHLICWGDDGRGQVGPRSAGTYRSEGLGVVRGAALGEGHTCAVLPGGELRCWGDNSHGQLGRFGPAERAPGRVEGLPPVGSVAAGDTSTCALSLAGEVWCWGDNAWGQLGDSGTTSRHTPRRVTEVEGASQIVMGDLFACALTPQGASCWGDNRRGQIGDAAEIVSAPVLVPGTAGMARLEAGGSTVCGVDASDALRCWGAGESGQLGVRAP